jgi:hypothetical protein
MHSKFNLTNWESISYLIAWHVIPTMSVNPKTNMIRNWLLSITSFEIMPYCMIALMHDCIIAWLHYCIIEWLHYKMVALLHAIRSEFTKFSAILKLEMSVFRGINPEYRDNEIENSLIFIPHSNRKKSSTESKNVKRVKISDLFQYIVFHECHWHFQSHHNTVQINFSWHFFPILRDICLKRLCFDIRDAVKTVDDPK